MSIHFRIVCFVSILLLGAVSTPANAQSWPTLTADRWANMTVQELNTLLEQNDIEARTEGTFFPGSTPLMHAARYSSTDVIRALLDAGAAVNAQQEQGYTPLLLAAWSTTDPERIRLLLEQGADVTAVNQSGSTAAMMTLWEKEGIPPTLPVLMEYGADLTVRDDFGNSIVHEAVQHNGSPETLRWLQEQGFVIDPDYEDTAMLLQMAARFGDHAEVVRFLIEDLGYDPNGTSDWHSRPPLWLAQHNVGGTEAQKEAIRDVLRAHGATKDGESGATPAPDEPAPAPVQREISLSESTVAPGQTIAVHFSGAEHARDWIGIYESDVQPSGDPPSEAWLYVNGRQSAGADLSNGTVRFTDHDLARGRYKVWFLADDGYEPLTDPIELVVAAPEEEPEPEEQIELTLSASTIAQNEALTVTFSGAEHTRDWIGIYELGVQPSGGPPSEAWLYVNGSQSAGQSVERGTVQFSGYELSPGDYAVWFLEDDGYEPLTDPVSFTVDPSASGGDDPALPPDGTNREPEILTHINEARSQGRMCGNDYFGATGPVAWDDDLEAAALVHSNDMAENVFRGHTGSDGSSAHERIQRQTDRFTATGEVLSYFYPTLESAVEGWLGSPGHCRIIMGGQFTHMGGAIDHGPRFDNPSREGPYRTAVFGGPPGS